MRLVGGLIPSLAMVSALPHILSEQRPTIRDHIMAIERVSATLARTQELPYTTFLNNTIELIKNPDSLAVYVYLQTKNERWIVRREDVMKRFEIGKHRYTEAMKHLRELGLVERKVTRGDKGQVVDNQLIIHYAPNALSSGLRTIGNPVHQESSSSGHLESNQSFSNESIDNNIPPNGSASADAGVQELELNEPLNTDKPGLKENGSSAADKVINIPFDDWWTIYGKKVDRKKCERKWNKLSNKTRLAIMEHTPKYVRATPETEYRKNPYTYLNSETWNDEQLPTRSQSWPNASYPTNQNNTKVDVDAAMAPRAVRRQESTPEQLKRNQEQAANLLNMFKGC